MERGHRGDHLQCHCPLREHRVRLREQCLQRGELHCAATMHFRLPARPPEAFYTNTQHEAYCNQVLQQYLQAPRADGAVGGAYGLRLRPHRGGLRARLNKLIWVKSFKQRWLARRGLVYLKIFHASPTLVVHNT